MDIVLAAFKIMLIFSANLNFAESVFLEGQLMCANRPLQEVSVIIGKMCLVSKSVS